ncbi:hypothetical protein [Xanthomonas citri]|uniref:hypothetical protein n=1 Tax=Xanthomonas citri TaxID=346 RepID=UPI0013F16416|nr:hypothetical protein [Xanthomonas citri]
MPLPAAHSGFRRCGGPLTRGAIPAEHLRHAMVTLALPHKGGEACNGDVHAAGSSAKQLTYVTSDGMARCRRRTRCLPTMSLAYRQALIEMADAVDCNARIVHCFFATNRAVGAEPCAQFAGPR